MANLKNISGTPRIVTPLAAKTPAAAPKAVTPPPVPSVPAIPALPKPVTPVAAKPAPAVASAAPAPKPMPVAVAPKAKPAPEPVAEISSVVDLDWTPFGTNMETAIGPDGFVYIRFDPNVRGAQSSTGKSTFVANTGGNIGIPNVSGIKAGINIYVPNK